MVTKKKLILSEKNSAIVNNTKGIIITDSIEIIGDLLLEHRQ